MQKNKLFEPTLVCYDKEYAYYIPYGTTAYKKALKIINKIGIETINKNKNMFKVFDACKIKYGMVKRSIVTQKG